MTAQEKLKNRIKQNYHICVGLDSDLEKIPEHLKSNKNPILDFNKSIIDATAEYSAAYKLNFAFYEKLGLKGWETLYETINYIPKDILIIADAKRGDIGNTSYKYAQAVFEELKCDSITLHPYMGFESVEPFLNYKDKISFILALTSNPSAADFEKQLIHNGRYLYQEVISKINDWNIEDNCGLVFGATNTNELIENISSFNDMPILLPGIGAQGGSLEEVVKAFMEAGKDNYIINVSRGILYIDKTDKYLESVTQKIIDYNLQIKEISN